MSKSQLLVVDINQFIITQSVDHRSLHQFVEFRLKSHLAFKTL